MNKSIFSFSAFTALIALSLITFSFSSEKSAIKTMEIKDSKIVWKAYKVTGSHEGTIDLTSGALTFDNDKLTGGEFTVDMTSIACTDLDGGTKEKLEGHLKSDDFFSVETFPTARLAITDVEADGKNSYNVKADLTIKGKTNPIEFEAAIYGNKANASIKIDRAKYDVRYGSTSFFDGLKNKAIYDEFDLIIDLEF